MFKLVVFFIFLTYCSFSQFSVNSEAQSRSLLSLFNNVLNSKSCGSRPCPPWKCQDDSTIIHGYCCSCPGSASDNVPVPCYDNLRCPISPYRLCSDYNWMITCCCTGP